MLKDIHMKKANGKNEARSYYEKIYADKNRHLVYHIIMCQIFSGVR